MDTHDVYIVVWHELEIDHIAGVYRSSGEAINRAIDVTFSQKGRANWSPGDGIHVGTASVARYDVGRAVHPFEYDNPPDVIGYAS